MPYFLRVDNEGVARIGGTFRDRPGDDWHQGSESNYLQRWDGSQWVDTPIAELLRQAQAADATVATGAERQRHRTAFRSRENRANRLAIKLIVKKLPGSVKWQDFLAELDAAIDADVDTVTP